MTAIIHKLPNVELRPANALGIDNIKASFAYILDVTNQGIELARDFEWSGALQLGFTLAEAQGMKGVFKKALAEFKDLDPQESERVADHIRLHFDISNDELEAAIEDAIDLLPEIYQTLRQNIATYNKVRSYFGRFKRVEFKTPKAIPQPIKKIA